MFHKQAFSIIIYYCYLNPNILNDQNDVFVFNSTMFKILQSSLLDEQTP